MGTRLPFPSFADVLYAAGMVIFIWWRTPYRDRRSLIDAMTLTAGLGLLSWIYLILPYVHNPALSWLQKSVAVAYPLGDVLVLAMIARLLAPGAARPRCVQLLTLGIVGELAADTSFGLMQLYGSFHNGTVVDLGWVVLYAAWGAAALHPTMTELTLPAARQHVEVSPARLTVLMLASLIAPVVLFSESIRIGGPDDSVIAVLSAILYLLVLSRLWDVAASHRRVLAQGQRVPGVGGHRGPGRGGRQVCDGYPARPGSAARRAVRGADRRRVPRGDRGLRRSGADGPARGAGRDLAAVRGRPGPAPRTGDQAARAGQGLRPRQRLDADLPAHAQGPAVG